jgi:hypothetical protein
MQNKDVLIPYLPIIFAILKKYEFDIFFKFKFKKSVGYNITKL